MLLHLLRRCSASSTSRHARYITTQSLTHTAHLTRTHHCAQLSAKDAGQRVILAGWLMPERSASKSFSFFPLRDAHGATQLVVFKPKKSDEGNPDTRNVLEEMSATPVESVVIIEGEVVARPPSQIRQEPAGDVEVHVQNFKLLNAAQRDAMPFLPSAHPTSENLPYEELRLKHRHLDLRRPQLASNIRKRSDVAHTVRNFLHDEGFVEVETPILLQSSPEGAREYLVPSRTQSAMKEPQFYALAQSPQQPKQLLIASGAVDRYFQLARCFRDEDGRRDRQPEFTQIDLEMGFVSWAPTAQALAEGWRIGGGEIRDAVEGMTRKVFALDNIELPMSFPVMRYQDAMAKYGSDKPDTRFGLEIREIKLPSDSTTESDTMTETLVVRATDKEFASVQQAVEQSLKDNLPQVKRFVVGDAARLSQHDPLTKSLDASKATLALHEGDTVWLASRQRVAEGGNTALGKVRIAIAEAAEREGLWTPPKAPGLLWVTEFPLFTHADEDKDALAHGRWSSSHHPFTAPMVEDLPLLEAGEYAKIRGQHFDLVLNGFEIGGGSVRIHDAAMQERVMRDVLQLDDGERASFAHLLNALKSGAPPHGGMALGFDRLMAILCGTRSIRDVIAFPKTSGGADLLFDSPSPISREVLKQYGLDVV
ncbi:tRNA synthetases class II-domain-containing protein [Auriculariales sp. MPI-PUGE-AT-0066]|nr:tRNA synthetases class II-domain-containing protein [Auriculariales sp. MPI-PUGE-AT-0066]